MRRLILLLTFILSTCAHPKFWFNVKKDVSFDLYTWKNQMVPDTLLINNTESIELSNFDPIIPTRIFIHGFQSRGEFRKMLIEAYFSKGVPMVNLIAVNWERTSHTWNYYAASSYVDKIGAHVAKFVDFMVNSEMLRLSDLTVIGFSLGAHIAGFTGKRVTVGKLPKIVGLDPASPLFSIDKPEGRLDGNDALYVETIHTSKLGFFKPLGVVSFYPFGGRFQPGCKWDITGQCAHNRAQMYFVASIISDWPLIGHLCESFDDIRRRNCTVSDQKAIMGGEPGALQQLPGTYYIEV